MAGKGDTYRPVDQDKWNRGWEAAFGSTEDKNKQEEIDEQLMDKMNKRMEEEDLND
tara:strand:- start:3945 stop:4112 length:168 start_codon:yes stop_codon:yes gene_type:complete